MILVQEIQKSISTNTYLSLIVFFSKIKVILRMLKKIPEDRFIPKNRSKLRGHLSTNTKCVIKSYKVTIIGGYYWKYFLCDYPLKIYSIFLILTFQYIDPFKLDVWHLESLTNQYFLAFLDQNYLMFPFFGFFWSWHSFFNIIFYIEFSNSMAKIRVCLDLESWSQNKNCYDRKINVFNDKLLFYKENSFYCILNKVDN